MDTVEDANRCVKYLDQSILGGQYITVEKSRRKHPRTPTPGHYQGLKSSRDGGRDDYDYHKSPRRSTYRSWRDYSPRRSPYHGGRDYSRRSPYGGRSGRDRSMSPLYSPRGSRGLMKNWLL